MRSITAYYNWGRWVAECPEPDCFGAEQLDRNQTAFECNCVAPGVCRHSSLRCGAEAFVSWPDDPETIEAVCEPRPVNNRNWHPYETVEDLRRENLDHGLEVS